MNLINFTLEGFRRFRNKTTIDLRGKIIAIVGPNEAGKSTLVMRALPRLTNPTPLQVQGPNQDITRGHTPNADDIILTAHYQLTADDQDAINHIRTITAPRILIAHQRVRDGRMQYRLDPRPQRDITSRKYLAERISTLLQDERALIESITSHDYGQLLPATQQILSGADEVLPKSALEQLQGISEAILADATAPAHATLRAVGTELKSLLQGESQDLESSIISILRTRIPPVLTLRTDDLNLLAEYPAEGIAAKTPAAFRNLARLANLNLQDLANAFGAGDHGMIETILGDASKILNERIREAWKQTPTTIRLSRDAGVIRIFARTEGVPFDSIAERSDGLRRFIALMGFLSQEQQATPPILLIDEIETHLHYDAQADLITMLSKQAEASKIIYTTHSAGSLPEDLTGIRSIEYSEDARSSFLKNWFWTDKRPGIGQLLFSMGAATLAFFSTRYAAITEGPTDFLLLPSMFREATGKDYLGFQVVPGIAQAGAADIGVLDREAPRTVYVLDADDAGRRIATKLIDAGIPSQRIFHIPDPGKQGLVLEDLIDRDAYHQAVTAGLQEVNGTNGARPVSSIPDVNRPGQLQKWCDQQHLRVPSKPLIARILLDQRGGRSIVSATHHQALRDLYEAVHKIFKSV